MKSEVSHIDPLQSLKEFTDARIALGRVGNSIPLKESLQFKLAHAHARDAVYSVLDIDGLTAKLEHFNLPILPLYSQASTRHKYLKRPDQGRRLSEESSQELKEYAGDFDIAIILADGLSAAAINENAVGLLEQLLPKLSASNFKVAPLCLVEQGRVAIADDTGYLLNAKFSIILIGERPGLSSAESMGAYLTYGPKPGLTDECRNCISNIRPQGLKSKPAAHKIYYLILEAFKKKLTGVSLKDNAGLPG